MSVEALEPGRDLSPLFSKRSDEWETPDELFEALRKDFKFTLDAAAVAGNAKCPAYFGPDHIHVSHQDALVYWQTWETEGAVWLNPPYSKVKAFVAKALEESSKGETIVMLLPARTDTRWFQDLLYNKPGIDIRFLKGRLKFKGGANSAPFPSMVVTLWGRRGVR